MHAFETILARLGSRFALNFRPRPKDNKLWTSPAGRMLDQPVNFALGVRVGEHSRVLPFAGELETFETVEQEISLTSVTFRAMSKALGIAAAFRFVAPFYPKDELLSHAPFFYIIASLAPMPSKEELTYPIKGELFLYFAGLAETPSRKNTSVAQEGSSLSINYIASIETRNPLGDWEITQRDVSCQEFIKLLSEGSASSADARLAAPFCLDATNSPFTASFVWAGYTSDEMLHVRGRKDHVFKYVREFPDARTVALWAEGIMPDALQKTEFFDSILAASSLSKTKQDFISFTFQSYLSNTWLTVSASDPEDEWFSVWEGNCKFHSTIDVEYNNGLIYYLLWPELLEKTFDEWSRHERTRPDIDGSFLSHDMGHGLAAIRQAYGHDMEIEENCNFILMLYALWRYTGQRELVQRYYELLKRLIKFIHSADRSGSGFPNEGIANTIDDASPAVQYAREQTYLGIKCLCAADVASIVAEAMNDPGFADLCSSIQSRIRHTLDETAWLGDHYAVCIDKRADLRKPSSWSSGVEPDRGELPGWDAYSIYTANGLLYLLMTGRRPELDYSRIVSDIVTSAKHSLSEYGCFHSSADHSNMWVSQNIWRDLVAAYLGVDQLDMADRYWAFELFENTTGTEGKGGCFIDTYGWNNLCYYPRGITSIGILYAMAGLTIDRVAGKLRINPIRRPLRIPIPTLADWSAGKVPWLEIRQSGEVIIEGKELLAPLEIELAQGLRLVETPNP